METASTTECSPKEITKVDIEKALKADKGEDAVLLSFTIKDFTKNGDNYSTLVAGVDIDYSLEDGRHHVSYVVKYRPGRIKMFGDIIYYHFQKEVMFYQHLVQHIQTQLEAVGQPPLRVPRCFHASLEKGRELMFLQDLRAEGFQMSDLEKGMDVRHTKLVLEELARLHAASILLKDKIPDLGETYPLLKVDWLNYSDDAVDTMHKALSKQMEVVKEFLEIAGGYQVAEDWLERNKSRPTEILEKQLERVPPFDVLCHGDCWNNNILFRHNEKGEPVEIMLLDLQLCRQASLATDICYFLNGSLEGPVRKQNLDTFLDTYYMAFISVLRAGDLCNPFSREELQMEYRKRQLYSVFLFLLITAIIVTEIAVKEDEDETDGMTLFKDNLIRPRLLAVFDELIENGVIT